MHVVADTTALVADGIITSNQAEVLKQRSRQVMVGLAINTLLCLGILSATGGLILWLKDALAVAICGAVAVGIGLAILSRKLEHLRMFGNAATLIGAGMLVGGGTLELVDKYEAVAGPVLAVSGLVLWLVALQAFRRNVLGAAFVVGAIAVMGLAVHLLGLGFAIELWSLAGLPVSLFYLYASVALAASGWVLDVRLVSALAILPFAQMLDTGTFYMHAIYAFYSPEPTLSIVQMSLLVAACVWIMKTRQERTARHARIIAVLAFVTANLCALVGSLWGDVVGETIWGPTLPEGRNSKTWELYRQELDTFRETAMTIPEGAFSILWAVALIAIALWAAHRNMRGLFNTALVFGVIHAYTQLFESFGDEPLAYVIGGFILIPVAWGMWQMDQALQKRGENSAG